ICRQPGKPGGGPCREGWLFNKWKIIETVKLCRRDFGKWKVICLMCKDDIPGNSKLWKAMFGPLRPNLPHL
ncbi:MAG: hypothetical protein SOX72_03940, partial [Oscillospiraceae bacterium]|nr:hypothetical protein [Oscillospiraceae bacterium]